MAVGYLAEGSVVGNDYRIVEPLGEGGMGAVYVAEQLSTGRRRALKVMHQRLADDPKQRERFITEARVGSLCESAHVVEVIAAGIEEDSGMPWIAMELLEGDDLAHHLSHTGPLDVALMLALLEQLCHALGGAHEAGVVHRDVKPENVFVSKPRRVGGTASVKVLDFGIAKLASHQRSGATTAIGSPAWMAPEQAEPEIGITPATDVWALGLLAFWMLTGKSYWKSAGKESISLHAIMKEVLFDALPRASTRAAEVGFSGDMPDGFDDWFDRCVHREPRARFRDAAKAYAALEAAMLGEPMPEPEATLDTGPVGAITNVPLSTRSFLSGAGADTMPLSETNPTASGDADADSDRDSDGDRNDHRDSDDDGDRDRDGDRDSDGDGDGDSDGDRNDDRDPPVPSSTAEPAVIESMRAGASPAKRPRWLAAAAAIVAGGAALAWFTQRPGDEVGNEPDVVPTVSAAKIFAEPQPSPSPPEVAATPSASASATSTATASATATAKAVAAVASPKPPRRTKSKQPIDPFASNVGSTPQAQQKVASQNVASQNIAPQAQQKAGPSEPERPPFDAAYAAKRVEWAQRNARQHCSGRFRTGGSYSYHGSIVFSPNGRVRKVTVSKVDPAGICVRGNFYGVRVRPFSGDSGASSYAVSWIGEPIQYPRKSSKKSKH